MLMAVPEVRQLWGFGLLGLSGVGLFSPGAKCHCVILGQWILHINPLEFWFRAVLADTKNDWHKPFK